MTDEDGERPEKTPKVNNECNTCVKCKSTDVGVSYVVNKWFGRLRGRKCYNCRHTWKTLESHEALINHYIGHDDAPHQTRHREKLLSTPKQPKEREKKYRVGDIVPDRIWEDE